MYEKTALDALTENSVSVKTQKYIEQDGVGYPIGLPHRCAYANSQRGRMDIAAALPEPYLAAVMAVWGDCPAVEEPDISQPEQ